MAQYECKFSVNGTRTEQTVTANDSHSARLLIESQYPTAKINWLSGPQQK